MAHLLLIDDDPALIPRQLRQAFPAPVYHVEVTHTGAQGLARVRAEPPDVVILDLRLPDTSGLEVYQEIRRIDSRIPVIFVTAAKTADGAIEAMRQGAYDYLFKPLDLEQLQRVVCKALDVARLMREPALIAEAAEETDGEGALVGTCPAMREVYKSIGRVSAQNVPVLITGESGTGKELVAVAIYQHGPRAKGPFLAINCAAIPESLLESELFGHEKGAFTGADRRRIGKFEQCHGGTLFLDEVGDMPHAVQAKILRVMQEQKFDRVGGNETILTDVRIIAATHHNLKAEAASGKFRQDLFYRLSVFSIHLPPLRDRGGDIQILVTHFLRRFCRELGRDVLQIAPEAMSRLNDYSWPGNVRELQSVIKQALLVAVGPTLVPPFLPADFQAHRTGSEVVEYATPSPRGTLDEVERETIQRCLRESGGNRQRTAELLGISPRTLLRKIRKYGLEDPLHLPPPDESPPAV